jgi:hypothetical protein
MHIIYERSGGFMGQTTKSSFDLSDLPEEDAKNLQTIIKEIDFTTLPENSLESQSAPDQFTYHISIQTQEWEQTIITSDSSAPPEVRPLIQSLNDISRNKKSK